MQSSAEYHGGDNIFVPIGNQINDSVRLHELSHQFLMKSTHWGIMTYLQTQLRRADRLYERLEYHFMIGNLLMQAAEITFESHAVLNELLMLEDQSSIMRITNGLYYKVYNTKYFETFSKLSASRTEIAYLSGRLPQLALATDLLELPSEIWKSTQDLLSAIMKDPKLYHPDTRFNILVDLYIELLEEFEPIHITDKMLIEKSGLCVKTIEYNTKTEAMNAFTHAMKNNYHCDECINNAFKQIYESIIMGDMEEILDNAELLDIPLPAEDIETINLTWLEPWIHDCSALIVMPYHELVLLQYHMPEQKKRYVCSCEWRALSIFLNKFKGAIILYEEDYDYMQEKYPEIFLYQPFFYYEGTYHAFQVTIKKKGVQKPQASLFLVDDLTSCLFIQLDNASVLFTVQNQGGTSKLFADISNGEFDFMTVGTDSILCKDNENSEHCVDAIKAVLHISEIKGRCNVEFS